MAKIRINPLVEDAMHAYNQCTSPAQEDKMHAALAAVAPHFVVQGILAVANNVEINGICVDHQDIREAAKEFDVGS